jgi:hypothetical protein
MGTENARLVDLDAILARQAAAREARGRRAMQNMVARQVARWEAQRQGSRRRHAERRAAAAGGNGGGQVVPKKGGP